MNDEQSALYALRRAIALLHSRTATPDEAAAISTLLMHVPAPVTAAPADSRLASELEAAIRHAGMDVCEVADGTGPYPLMLVWSGTITPVTPQQPAAASDETERLRDLLRKARNVAVLCDPAVRAKQPPMANSLEAMAYNLVHEIDEAITTQPAPAAAPGIDMGVPGATLTIDGKTFTVDEVRAALDAQPSPVVKQNLTTQPAAAQEAAYQVRRGIGEPWKECDRAAFDVVTASRPADARKLYAAPVTAAPANADEDAYVIDQMGKLLAEIAVIVNGPEPAGTRWSYHDLPAKVKALASTRAAPVDTWFADQLTAMGEVIPLASTPAAPRIDLRNAILQLREDALHMKDPGDTVNAYNRVLALIDASPKGELESWKRGTKACAEVLGQVTRELAASPKGGSDARDAARYRFLREVAHPDSDDGIAVTIQKQDSWGNWRDMHLHGPELDSATDAAMQAQAGDAEVQP